MSSIVAVPSLIIGKYNFAGSDFDNLICLYAPIGATNFKSTLRKVIGSSSAGYAPSGVDFHVKAIEFNTSQGSAVGDDFGVGYADNDVGFISASAFTNFAGLGGATEAQSRIIVKDGIQSTEIYGRNSAVIHPIGFIIPAGKFGAIVHTDGASKGFVMYYGVEV